MIIGFLDHHRMALAHQPDLPFQHAQKDMLGDGWLVLVCIAEDDVARQLVRRDPVVSGERDLHELDRGFGWKVRATAASDQSVSLTK